MARLEAKEGSEQRSVLYCLIPRELSGELHDDLRHHFAEDPDVEVVVERRRRDRRGGAERRTRDEPRDGPERRRIRSAEGRRAGERRAPLVEVEPPPLPTAAQAHVARLVFVERLEPSSEDAEDLDSARLVTDFQAGDGEAFESLYMRYFDRVYAYLRVLLKDAHEAEDGTQQVFIKVFEALPRYERRGQPLRAWLFTIVRNHALSDLRKRGRVELEGPEEIERLIEGGVPEEPEVAALGWISDRDLLLFVERLPLAQRQVLTLRYMMEMDNREVGEVLGRSPSEVRVLHYRAVSFLRDRLAAIEEGERRRSSALLTH
ncbi:MAG: RNA polymerase sigma factor [Solirubrobacterales bacterium]